jgi:hypothetical protein
VKLPRSLKDISAQQYQEIFPSIVELNKLDDVLERSFKWCKIISILTIKHVDEIEDLDIKILKNHINQLSFLLDESPKLIYKHLWVNGSLYRGVNNAEQLNASQIVAIKTFLSQGNYVDQLHNLAPCCYKKLTWKGWKYNGDDHVKVSNAMIKKSAHKTLPVVFFCSKVLQYLMENSATYLSSQKIIKERMEEINQAILDGSFSNIGDGMQLSMK